MSKAFYLKIKIQDLSNNNNPNSIDLSTQTFTTEIMLSPENAFTM